MANMYVRFHTGRPGEEKESQVYGPYEYVEGTYSTLRISPNGDDLAFMNGEGEWEVMVGPNKDEVYSDFIVTSDP